MEFAEKNHFYLLLRTGISSETLAALFVCALIHLTISFLSLDSFDVRSLNVIDSANKINKRAKTGKWTSENHVRNG